MRKPMLTYISPRLYFYLARRRAVSVTKGCWTCLHVGPSNCDTHRPVRKTA